MKDQNPYLNDLFVSLPDLLKMEGQARTFSYLSKKHKVNALLTGKHISRQRGRGLDFEEVREYVKGDDIRNIDWKVTARTRKTHTRVYTEEKEKPVLIVVNQSKPMFFGSIKRTKSVVAAELAALAAFKVLKEGDRVGGVVMADEGIDFIAPRRNRKSVMHFLQKVVQRNQELKTSFPGESESVLDQTIQRVNNVVTHDFVVVIISDFLEQSQKVIKAIGHLAKHNSVLLIQVLDPMEKALPQAKFIAGDHSHQIALDGKNPKIRNSYDQGVKADFDGFQEIMSKLMVPVFQINTVDSIDSQLKEVFNANHARQ